MIVREYGWSQYASEGELLSTRSTIMSGGEDGVVCGRNSKLHCSGKGSHSGAVFLPPRIATVSIGATHGPRLVLIAIASMRYCLNSRLKPLPYPKRESPGLIPARISIYLPVLDSEPSSAQSSCAQLTLTSEKAPSVSDSPTTNLHTSQMLSYTIFPGY
jgi:hypothetical protein